MFVVVLAVDLVALVLHNILTCRSNTEGKTPRHRIEVYYCNYVITDCIVSASPSTFFFVWARVKNCRKLQKQNISSRNDEWFRGFRVFQQGMAVTAGAAVISCGFGTVSFFNYPWAYSALIVPWCYQLRLVLQMPVLYYSAIPLSSHKAKSLTVSISSNICRDGPFLPARR